MYLKNVSNHINRKDIRAVRKWCKKNHLQIYKDSSGEFVYENDFDLAFDMPLINQLKLKYGNDWQDYYHAYNKNELYKMLDFDVAINKKNGYVPKGKLSSKIFGRSLK